MSLLLGPFTEQERTNFINEFSLNYLMRHPKERDSFARRQARHAWRVKVHKAMSEILTS